MITKAEAVSFLREHQPMPQDQELKEEEIKKYEEVRTFFIKNPDEQCIPLFLNSFGGKDGLGVYQMVEDVLVMYDKRIVLPYILHAFRSSYGSVQYWCIQIASNFPDESLFLPLVHFLQSEDLDIKAAAIIAIAQLALNHIKGYEILNILKEELKKISDAETKELAAEVLTDIQSNIRV